MTIAERLNKKTKYQEFSKSPIDNYIESREKIKKDRNNIKLDKKLEEKILEEVAETLEKEIKKMI